jgi:hypothetical protein
MHKVISKTPEDAFLNPFMINRDLPKKVTEPPLNFNIEFAFAP